MREQIAILFGSEPTFDIFAFKYFILNLNKIQNQFEFCFPDIPHRLFTNSAYSTEDLYTIYKDKYITKIDEYGLVIVIIKSRIWGNYFSCGNEDAQFITTDCWNKYFSPPSLFEYLLHAIISRIIFANDELDLGAHLETCGCILDQARIKADYRVGISLGYISDEVGERILTVEGEEYLNALKKMHDSEWIGDIEQKNTVAYNLKHYFSFDIDKESGFNKNFWERARAKFPDIPKDVITQLLNAILIAILSALFVLLGLKSRGSDSKDAETLKSEVVQLKSSIDSLRVEIAAKKDTVR